MNNRLDEQYQRLLQDILEYGVDKNDRTGTGCKSIFGYTIHHNMRNGFPLLTTKKVPFKTMATELMWFLMGDTNIKYLVDNGCHIWNGDAIKNYEKHNGVIDWGPFVTKEEAFIESMKDEEFAKKWGELGPIYGKQWRSWKTQWHQLAEQEGYTPKWAGDVETEVDQIQNLINDLKTNPDSRRLMVSAWNVGELDQMVLPPCHYGFQVYTRELSDEERLNWYKERNLKYSNTGSLPKRAISLMWNQRSIDSALGLPFNIASYGLLLEMIAREVNMIPEHLIGHLGDCHLYSDHLEGAKEQISREPRELPRLHMSSGHNFRAALAGKADEIDLNDFMLIGYDPHPTIKFPLSN